MLDKLLLKSGHLADAAIQLLANGGIDGDDVLPLLNHITACPKCMAVYISSLPEDQEMLSETPDGMEERILLAVRSERTQNEERSKKIMAFKYIKLAVAVCLTIVLMYGGIVHSMSSPGRVQNDIPRQEEAQNLSKRPPTNPLMEFSTGLSAGFRDFADKLNFNFLGDGKDESK